MTTSRNITIQIMDKHYQIKCPSDKESELREAAAFLDKKMQEIRDSSKIIGLDRVAILTGLNLAHEIVAMHTNKDTETSGFQGQIETICEKVEKALTINEQEEL